MRLRLRGINLTLPRRIDGKPIRVPVIAGLKIGLTGEMYLLDLLYTLLPASEGAIVDIGANIGQTLSKAKLADPARPYYGFEPNPACFHYLDRFIEVNKWKNITLFPFGIADQTSILRLHTSAGKATDPEATFLPDANPNHHADSSRTAVVLDYARVAPFIKEPIAFLKIDVEGMELDIIKSLRTAIMTDLPVVVLEMLSLPSLAERHAESVELLNSFGYRVFFIETDKKRRLAGLKEIRSYENIAAPLKADYVALTGAHAAAFDSSIWR